jgi:hypothetical protein
MRSAGALDQQLREIGRQPAEDRGRHGRAERQAGDRPSPGNCSAVATAPTALTPPASAASTTAPSSACPCEPLGHQREHGDRQHALAEAQRDQHRLAPDPVGQQRRRTA